MAEIIINTKEVIERKSYYPDFINIIINSKEFIIPTYKESANVDNIDNIQFDCSINRDMCTAVISYIDSNIQTYCYFKKYDEFLDFKSDIENILLNHKFHIKSIIQCETKH